jgi:hypothetical protein
MSDKSTALQQFTPTTFEQLDALAKRLAQSQLLPKPLQGKPADVAVILLTGHELGLSAMASLRGMHVIEGKAVMSADLMSGMVQARPDVCEYFRLIKSTDELATYETKRRGHDQAVQLTYTIAQATKAGLTKRPTWIAHPAAMLRARCSSALCRAVYSDIMQGVYDEDEGTEIAEHHSGNGRGTVIDVTPSEGPSDEPHVAHDAEAQSIIDQIATTLTVESLKDLVPSIRLLPRTYQAKIKPVYDVRKAAIEAGEIADPEPFPESSTSDSCVFAMKQRCLGDYGDRWVGLIEAATREEAVSKAEVRWPGWMSKHWTWEVYPYAKLSPDDKNAVEQAHALREAEEQDEKQAHIS